MHRPRRRFGQHFLADQEVLGAIVAAIDPRPEEHLVEIGPGRGALTERLLRACPGLSLDVIELDRDLVVWLQRSFAAHPGLRIHQADALQCDLRELTQGNPLRVVGNLPYNISTPILFHLFDQAGLIADMVFLLQKEVVDRLCALPGSGAYGRLTVMAGYYCRAEKLFDVPPDCFFPKPKVMSSLIRLAPHGHPPVHADATRLRRVVAEAFSQRRKTLRNALRNLVSATDLMNLGIDPANRAENLSLADFARIARGLTERE